MGYPKWTAPELALLHNFEHRALKDRAMEELLLQHGFTRTIKAISKKRSLEHLNGEVDHDQETLGYTPTGLARCLGLHHTTILRHVRSGFIKATPQDREGQQPIFRIKRREIKRFLKENIHLWDHRKADQYWLVDILTRC